MMILYQKSSLCRTLLILTCTVWITSAQEVVSSIYDNNAASNNGTTASFTQTTSTTTTTTTTTFYGDNVDNANDILIAEQFIVPTSASMPIGVYWSAPAATSPALSPSTTQSIPSSSSYYNNVLANLRPEYQSNNTNVMTPAMSSAVFTKAPLSSLDNMPCSICNSGQLMTLATKTIPAGMIDFIYIDMRCYDIEKLGQSIQFTRSQCLALKTNLNMSSYCGCGTPPVRAPYTYAPTLPPVPTVSPITMIPTLSPITSAPIIITSTPTSIPTMKDDGISGLNLLYIDQGSILICLYSVSELMTKTTIETYQNQLTLFLNEHLNNDFISSSNSNTNNSTNSSSSTSRSGFVENPIMNITATLIDQTLITNENNDNNGSRERKLRSSSRRRLQQSSGTSLGSTILDELLYPLDTYLKVTGYITSNSMLKDSKRLYNAAIIDAILNDPITLISNLQNSVGILDSFYFSTISQIEVSDPTLDPNRYNGNSADDSDGSNDSNDNTNAMLTALIVGLVVILCIMPLGYFTYKYKQRIKQQSRTSPMIINNNNDNNGNPMTPQDITTSNNGSVGQYSKTNESKKSLKSNDNIKKINVDDDDYDDDIISNHLLYDPSIKTCNSKNIDNNKNKNNDGSSSIKSGSYNKTNTNNNNQENGIVSSLLSKKWIDSIWNKKEQDVEVATTTIETPPKNEQQPQATAVPATTTDSLTKNENSNIKSRTMWLTKSITGPILPITTTTPTSTAATASVTPITTTTVPPMTASSQPSVNNTSSLTAVDDNSKNKNLTDNLTTTSDSNKCAPTTTTSTIQTSAAVVVPKTAPSTTTAIITPNRGMSIFRTNPKVTTSIGTTTVDATAAASSPVVMKTSIQTPPTTTTAVNEHASVAYVQLIVEEPNRNMDQSMTTAGIPKSSSPRPTSLPPSTTASAPVAMANEPNAPQQGRSKSLAQRFRRQLTAPISNRASRPPTRQQQQQQQMSTEEVVVGNVRDGSPSTTTRSNHTNGSNTVSSPSLSDDHSSIIDQHPRRHPQSNHADGADSMSYAFSLDGAGTNDDATRDTRGGWTSSTGSPTSHNRSSVDAETVSVFPSDNNRAADKADDTEPTLNNHHAHQNHSSPLSKTPPISSVRLSSIVSASGVATGSVKKVTTSAFVSSGMGHSDKNIDKTTSSVDDSDQGLFQSQERMVQRIVYAPTGKLGIIIDTTIEGPIVHKVFPRSPLEGSIFVGDIIIGIDDIDTRAMSANSISDVMIQTANKPRKLTVITEDINMGIKKK